MAGLQPALIIVAIILFVLSAIPPVPYSATLARVGLAFFAAAHMAG